MTLSHDETKRLIERVLETASQDARQDLHLALLQMKRSEPEFCMGVVEHGPGMTFTSDQWFDFFSKVPNILFEHEPKLMSKLSENQKKALPFGSG